MLEASRCIFNYWRHEVTVYQLIMDSLIHPANGSKALLMGRALGKLVFVGNPNCGIVVHLKILENGFFCPSNFPTGSRFVTTGWNSSLLNPRFLLLCWGWGVALHTPQGLFCLDPSLLRFYPYFCCKENVSLKNLI